jgi:ornithine decarboxylase
MARIRATERPMATQRILDFLATRRPSGPCLVVDLDVVADNFRAFEKALPESKIYYAVKANPAPEILRLLASSSARPSTPPRCRRSRWRWTRARTADRISFGNTIKKERDIAACLRARRPPLRRRLRRAEVDKIARAAPGPACSAAS